MEQDLIGARRRETTFKNRKRRKERWLTRKWKIAKGNTYINVKAWNIVVFKKGLLWSGRISRRNAEETYFLKSWFSNIDIAKLEVLEMLEAYIRRR